MSYRVMPLPSSGELETYPVLRQLTAASWQLLLLRGSLAIIPNEHIRINTLALQEVKNSSAVRFIKQCGLYPTRVGNIPLATQVMPHSTKAQGAYTHLFRQLDSNIIQLRNIANEA